MNTMNTVETQEEKNNQLRFFMETNKPVCAVHPACTFQWVDTTHLFHLGCPWFPECKYKVAVDKFLKYVWWGSIDDFIVACHGVISVHVGTRKIQNFMST